MYHKLNKLSPQIFEYSFENVITNFSSHISLYKIYHLHLHMVFKWSSKYKILSSTLVLIGTINSMIIIT